MPEKENVIYHENMKTCYNISKSQNVFASSTFRSLIYFYNRSKASLFAFAPKPFYVQSIRRYNYVLIFCNARIRVTDTVLYNKNLYFVELDDLSWCISTIDCIYNVLLFEYRYTLKFYEHTVDIAIVFAREIRNRKNWYVMVLDFSC